MLYSLISGVFLVAAAISFLRDRRRLRNGVFLLLGLGFGWLGVLIVAGNDSAPVVITLALIILFVLSGPVLAIFLVLNGVVMLRREGRSLGNLLSLLTGVLLIAVPIGLAALQSAFPPLAVVTAAVTLVAGYVAFVFASYLVYSLIYSNLPPRRRPEYVVILGSGLIGSEVPPLLAARLDAAVRLFQGSHGARIRALIPSGGQGSDELTAEGTAMALYLKGKGVPDDRILVEDKAATTMENLAFSRELMHSPDSPVTVVTSSYHVFRAAMFTRRAGLRAHVTGAKTAGYFVPSAFLREFIAILVTYKWLNAAFCAALLTLPAAVVVVSLLVQ